MFIVESNKTLRFSHHAVVVGIIILSRVNEIFVRYFVLRLDVKSMISVLSTLSSLTWCLMGLVHSALISAAVTEKVCTNKDILERK